MSTLAHSPRQDVIVIQDVNVHVLLLVIVIVIIIMIVAFAGEAISFRVCDCVTKKRSAYRSVRGRVTVILCDSLDGNLLLLEIPPILFINEDQIQIVPCREALCYVSECGREIEASEE